MPEARTVMLVRTRSDPATHISYRWAEAVRQHFEANGWLVLDLALENAIRSKVAEALQSSESCLFLFYGHGAPEEMVGQDGISVVNIHNVDLLKHQKVYVVACWTARRLGRKAEGIARCYLGYDREVMVWLQSPYADHLGTCVNRGILGMLNTPGFSIGEARQQVIEEYTRWIDYFATGEGALGPSAFEFAAELRHNRDALAQVFGDASAPLIDDKPNPTDDPSSY